MEVPHTPTHSILIIEDDSFLRNIIKSHLEKIGFVVLEATTGEVALHTIEETRPSLVILDIVLSGMSGLDVMAKVRTNPSTATIPFIVFTNSDEDAHQKRGEELGAVKYLVKAISTPEQIVKEVQGYFAMHQ